jgi:RecA-family ATPase
MCRAATRLEIFPMQARSIAYARKTQVEYGPNPFAPEGRWPANDDNPFCSPVLESLYEATEGLPQEVFWRRLREVNAEVEIDSPPMSAGAAAADDDVDDANLPPMIRRALTAARRGMRQGDDLSRLLALQAGVRDIARLEGKGGRGIDALYESAIAALADHPACADGRLVDVVQSMIAGGVKEGLSTPDPGAFEGGIGQGPHPLGEEGPKPENIPRIHWLDMSRWDDEPIPQRQWAILNRVPLKQAGLFSGEGGTGKSMIELHRDVAHVIGGDWLGSLPEPGPAFYVGAEDDVDEIHIRLGAVAKHCGVTFARIVSNGLYVLPLFGNDATMCAVTKKSGKIETTALYQQLYEAAGDIRPKNISIDTLSHAFAGNEIDRAQVYGFMRHMQTLAMVARGSVTVLSHPSLSGIQSGSGLSGSTAWHGAARFRMYLTGVKADDGEQPDSDLRQLEFRKNQYGPLGETIVLRYQDGLFLPLPGVASIDKAAQEARADDVFLTLLRRFTNQNRNVGDKKGTNYAPALFAKEEEAKRAGLGNSHLEAAMRRLFVENKIHLEPYGRPYRGSVRLAIGGVAEVA